MECRRQHWPQAAELANSGHVAPDLLTFGTGAGCVGAACGLLFPQARPAAAGKEGVSGGQLQDRGPQEVIVMAPHSDRKIRYAVVGQGWFAQTAILPAFANAADNSVLAALVSGDPEKRRELSKKYSVPAYGYELYDSLLAGGTLGAVYLALPNSMHREFTERAARHGVHVLCEKPMAPTVDDCQVMIDACDRAGVKLMIAYRLHFEEGNMKAVELVQSGRIGEPRLFSSVFTQRVGEGNIRLESHLGGGPLGDVGIYCINAARYLFREDPVEVVAFAATADRKRFEKVPEMVGGILRFPDERLATILIGFGEADVSTYRVIGTKGNLRMEPAYGFDTDLVQYLTVGEKTEAKTFRRRDQVAPEILYFSDCILRDQQPEPSGWEGLADVRVIEGLKQSLLQGKAVPLQPSPAKKRPGADQQIKRPAHSKPELVDAAPPSGS
jgi:glucose-fructose oxidoreductase